MTAGPPGKRRLGVLVDGIPLPEEEALALWERFSTWMDENRGDLEGFAVQEGFLSVHPGVDGDRPVLRASVRAAQRPYASVQAEPATVPSRNHAGGHGGVAPGGSPARQGGPPGPDPRGANRRDSGGKRRK